MVKKIIAHLVLVSFVLSQNVFAMDVPDESGQSRSTSPRFQGDSNPSNSSTPSTPYRSGQSTPVGTPHVRTPQNGGEASTVVPHSQVPTPSRSLILPTRDLTADDFKGLPDIPQRFKVNIDEKYKPLDTFATITVSAAMAFGVSSVALKAFDSIPGLNQDKKQLLMAASFAYGIESFIQHNKYLSEDRELSWDPALGRGPAGIIAGFVLGSMAANLGSILHTGLSLFGFDPLSSISHYVKVTLPPFVNVGTISLLADNLIFLKDTMPWMQSFESSKHTPLVEQLDWFQRWTDQVTSDQLQNFTKGLPEGNDNKILRLKLLAKQGQEYKEEFAAQTWIGQHSGILKTLGVVGLTTTACMLVAGMFKSKDLSQFSISDVTEVAQSGFTGFKGSFVNSVSFFKNLLGEDAPKPVSSVIATSVLSPVSPSSSSWILLPLSIKLALGFVSHFPDIDFSSTNKNTQLLLRREGLLLQNWVKALGSEVQEVMNINSIENFLAFLTSESENGEPEEENLSGIQIASFDIDEEAQRAEAEKMRLAEEAETARLAVIEKQRIADEAEEAERLATAQRLAEEEKLEAEQRAEAEKMRLAEETETARVEKMEADLQEIKKQLAESGIGIRPKVDGKSEKENDNLGESMTYEDKADGWSTSTSSASSRVSSTLSSRTGSPMNSTQVTPSKKKSKKQSFVDTVDGWGDEEESSEEE